jgi:farnesyl-diphosphate farnesyltransferase
LTLRALPPAIRSQIGLAYLLARTTDTVADTELIPVAQRLEALGRLRERLLGRSATPVDFGALAQRQASPDEAALLRRNEEAAQSLDQLAEADRARVRRVLEIIISGQELDLKRFGAAKAEDIAALATEADLDDYIYRVAGCVGEFWTDMCLAHLFEMEPPAAAALRANGIRFGKGLQLVNVLRDLPRDLRQGRCYIPSARLAEAGLAPGDLLRADKMPEFRPLYDSYLDLMEAHLAAGWEYTDTLPRAQVRVRLACAWLILIGAGTLRRLRVENALDSSRRIKISRGQVYRIMARSVVLHPWPGAWRRQFRRARPA